MIAPLLDRSLMENRRNWITLPLGSFCLFRVDCALRRGPADRLLASFRKNRASSDPISSTQVLTSRSRCWVRFVDFRMAVAVDRSWVRSAQFRHAIDWQLGSFGAISARAPAMVGFVRRVSPISIQRLLASFGAAHEFDPVRDVSVSPVSQVPSRLTITRSDQGSSCVSLMPTALCATSGESRQQVNLTREKSFLESHITVSLSVHYTTKAWLSSVAFPRGRFYSPRPNAQWGAAEIRNRPCITSLFTWERAGGPDLSIASLGARGLERGSRDRKATLSLNLWRLGMLSERGAFWRFLALFTRSGNPFDDRRFARLRYALCGSSRGRV